MFTNRLAPKFFLIVSIMVILSSVLLTTIFLRNENNVLVSVATRHADSITANIASNAEYAVLTRNSALLEGIVHSAMLDKSVTQITITDKSGSILIASGGSKNEPSRTIAKPIVTKQTKSEKSSKSNEEIMFPEDTQKDRPEEEIGSVRLTFSLMDIYRLIDNLKRKAALITALIVLLSMGVMFLLIRRITKPLQELVSATEKISEGDLSHKVVTKTTDEVGRLGDAFNRMTAELSKTLVSKGYVDNVIGSMLDTLIVINPDLTIKSVNRATTQLLGYTESELLNQPLSMIFGENPLFREGSQSEGYQRLMQNGSLQNIEETYVTKDGRHIPMLFSGSVLPDSNGKMEGVVCVALDISERKKAQERYRSLVETMPDTIFTIGLDSCFTSFNAAFEKICGYRIGDWIGRNGTDLVVEEDAPAATTMFAMALKGLHPPKHELRLKTNFGQMTGEFTIAPQIEDGKVVGIFGLVRDLTEHKFIEHEKERLAKSLLQSEKMAAVGQLAGGVAHEINNPLGVILGFAQSLMRTLKPEDALYMPLTSIEREAKRCKNLVQDLLTFSRVNKLEKENCDLNEVVGTALTLVAAQTKVQNIELIRNLNENIPLVKLSRNQIQQVVINLCTNAIDAMAKGGTLTVSTMFPTEMRGEYVQIRVTDNGTGIPREIVGNIFEPFFTTKEVGKGTGLGLSLVYEIVNKHHGTIDVESEVGEGTTFKINLPVTEK